jgi:bacterioferritin-associated ferredoxin
MRESTLLTIIRKLRNLLVRLVLGKRPWMIVCVCNRLNDTKIRGAIACGASSPDQVYAHHGARKVCGTCQETIVTMLNEAREAQAGLQAAE